MILTVIRHIGLCLLALLFSFSVYAQDQKQKELEQRKQEILKEIELINELQSKTRQKERSVLSSLEDMNYKISVRKNLIKVTNQQVNLLTRQINKNQEDISAMREELKILKDNYAEMIVKSYKSKNEQSKVMFLLSSDNFQQAFKRLQYIKQFANYQKKQGEEIKLKTLQLQETNKSLLVQKSEKQKLIDDNKKAQNRLVQEQKQQEELKKSVQKSINKYALQLKTKQREANRIDRQIKRLIREAIASSNRKAGKSSSSTGFALTPEDKILAANFVSNKGKLPWPVEKGVVKLGYGKQPHPVVKSVIIQSNGVRIATEETATVRAVFDGEVSEIMLIPNANPVVMIRHGNYLTIYKNLSKINVKKGDKVSTKQKIGEVYTNKRTGESILGFGVYEDGQTRNPANWLYKM